MAILENGPNGGFTGKVGSVTGYYSNGKWIIRGLRKPSKKNKKGTAKQNACRNRFSLMQHFLSPLIPFLRIGFNMESRKRMMTAHNVAKSYNMLHAQNLDGSIDYSKVCLSYGSIIGPENPKVMVDDLGFHFSWTDNTGSDYDRANDQAMLIAYNVEKGVTYQETGGAKRKKCLDLLEITNADKGDIFHVWISFISEDRQHISMSTYCGSFVF